MKTKFLAAFVGIFFLPLTLSLSSLDDEWKNFKIKFNKMYTKSEEEKRREIFRENLEFIRKHNENGSFPYELEVNMLSDKKSDEFVKKLGDARDIHRIHNTFMIHNIVRPDFFKHDKEFKAPDSFDWRDKGAVNKVKSQINEKNCHSSYAFAAVSALESHHFIKTGKLIDLSEQEVVDCSKGNDGCNGGRTSFSYSYMIHNGIATEKDYGYKDTETKCRNEEKPRSEVKVHGYIEVHGEENIKNAIVKFGPVAVGINVSPSSFIFYKSGVITDPQISISHDDFVVLVGYGTDNDNGLPYWIVRNSWSEDWGEGGYMKLLRNNETFATKFSAFFPDLEPKPKPAKEANADKFWAQHETELYIIMVFGVIVTVICIIFFCCCFYLWCDAIFNHKKALQNFLDFSNPEAARHKGLF